MPLDLWIWSWFHCERLICSSAILDPRVGHTMNVLFPFISVLFHSDWLFYGESCPHHVVHPGCAWWSWMGIHMNGDSVNLSPHVLGHGQWHWGSPEGGKSMVGWLLAFENSLTVPIDWMIDWLTKVRFYVAFDTK